MTGFKEAFGAMKYVMDCEDLKEFQLFTNMVNDRLEYLKACQENRSVK